MTNAVPYDVPLAFSHPAFRGAYGDPSVHYLAVGRPDLSAVFPKSKAPDWNALSRLGAVAALQVGQDTYIEVRALRGAFIRSHTGTTGTTHAFAAGPFLFPARKPLVLGTYKSYQTFSWDADLPVQGRAALAMASVGKNGQPVYFDRETSTVTEAPGSVRKWLASCLSLSYFFDREDDLGLILRSIEGVRQGSSHGPKVLFRRIFGSGSAPQKFEGPVQAYVPDNVTVGYDMAVPLKRPDDLTHRDTVLGYDLARSRFIALR